MLDLILVIIGLIYLSIASFTDIKTREVPDWISYSLIIIGLGLRLIYSLTQGDFTYIIYGLLGFGTFFIIANFMYYTKQWGGADAKLLMGLGAMFATTPNIPYLTPRIEWPFLSILLLNILIIGSIYGIFWAIAIAIKEKKKFTKEFKKYKHTDLKISWVATIILSLITLILLGKSYFFIILVMGLTVVLSIHLIKLTKIVEKVGMYKWLTPSQLTEGDWVAKEIKIDGKYICGPKDLGLEKYQIKLLKKYKIKKILTKHGIPFVPAFLIALIVTLTLGNLFSYII